MGLLLLAAGLAFVFVPSSAGHVARWFARLLPVFLICAGVVRVMGFAVERKPRSPVDGMLLICIGVLWLANRFHPELNGLRIYGRYWLLLLGVFAAVDLVRYYSHRETDGPPPRLFTAGRLMVIIFIAVTGVLAGRLSGNNPSLLSALHLDGFLNNLRDSVVGQEYSFTDQTVEISGAKPGIRVTVNNSYGDVKVTGGSASLKATLTKGVRAWDEGDAGRIAEQIKIIVEQTSDGVQISTNRDQFTQQFTTDLNIEVPASARVEITDSYGQVSASELDANLDISGSHLRTAINSISGDVLLSLSYSDVEASSINGRLKVVGAKNARISSIDGPLSIAASNGTIDVRDASEVVEINAPFCRITAHNLQEAAIIKTEHGNVRVIRAAEVTIEAPYSPIRIEEIAGDLNIASSNSDIQLRSIAGGATVAAQRSSVNADEVHGQVDFVTSHGNVTVKNFHSGVRVLTSYRDVMLVASSQPSADIEVENSHGEIRLSLPQSSQFQIDALSENGQVRE